jgi:hypothetical protein
MISPPLRIESMPRLTTIEGMLSQATRKPMNPVTATPARTGTSQLAQIGHPATAIEPESTASTPIKEPTETSMLPETITIDMPIAATAT